MVRCRQEIPTNLAKGRSEADAHSHLLDEWEGGEAKSERDYRYGTACYTTVIPIGSVFNNCCDDATYPYSSPSRMRLLSAQSMAVDVPSGAFPAAIRRLRLEVPLSFVRRDSPAGVSSGLNCVETRRLARAGICARTYRRDNAFGKLREPIKSLLTCIFQLYIIAECTTGMIELSLARWINVVKGHERFHTVSYVRRCLYQNQSIKY